MGLGRRNVKSCHAILCLLNPVFMHQSTAVVFCAMLNYLTWWLCPIWRIPSIVEGFGVSDMASVTCNDTGYSEMPLGVACGLEPGGRSWGTSYCDSYLHTSLGRGMIDNVFKWHSFVRVKFSFIESSERSSNKFLQFIGTVTLWIRPNVDNVSPKTTWYWGKRCPVLMFNNNSNDPVWDGDCPR